MSNDYRFKCKHCGALMTLRVISPLKRILHCPACPYKFEFVLPTTNYYYSHFTVQKDDQANDRTWGEITRAEVPQAFQDAFEGEELTP